MQSQPKPQESRLEDVIFQFLRVLLLVYKLFCLLHLHHAGQLYTSGPDPRHQLRGDTLVHISVDFAAQC